MMSVWRWGAVAAVALLGSVPATAQQSTPSGLIPGIARQAFTRTSNGFCVLEQSDSTFERNGTNTIALVALPRLGYNAGQGFKPLDGQLRLTFTTTNSGTVRFKGWNNPNGSQATGSFSNYSQTYSGQYMVTFNLVLPDGCTLAVTADYEVAP